MNYISGLFFSKISNWNLCSRYPIKFEPSLQTMTDDCYTCPMFVICNGCRKTIKDHKDYGITMTHCTKMKTLASDIIDSNKNSKNAIKENY